jgi:hypothetical protein
MLWDILFAVGIGLTQLVLTWYGVHVSVRENRIRNAIIIALVGFVGIGLTVGGTIRNSINQDRLQAQLNKIQRNTEQPPTVQVNVPPPTVLTTPIPKEASLKNRLLQAANEYERFFRRRAKHQPTCDQTSTMSPEEQRAVLEPCNKYAFELMAEYQQRFAPNIMAMVEECRAKGINVRDIENCAPQGWYCGIGISVQLRAFAARLDANDNVKR